MSSGCHLEAACSDKMGNLRFCAQAGQSFKSRLNRPHVVSLWVSSHGSLFLVPALDSNQSSQSESLLSEERNRERMGYKRDTYMSFLINFCFNSRTDPFRLALQLQAPRLWRLAFRSRQIHSLLFSPCTHFPRVSDVDSVILDCVCF